MRVRWPVTMTIRYSFFSSFVFFLALAVSNSAAFAGICAIPPEAQPVDTSNPNIVVGDGTPQSCTSDAFVQAVAQGGIITFNCGPSPVTVTLDRTAKVFNDKGPEIVIDGGGKVTLSGGGQVRILYMNTCDPNQVWTTPHCDNQDHPRLTVQNLTFRDGNATGASGDYDPGGGGAIFVRGGRFKVVKCKFIGNVCDSTGPDVGGAAIRVFDQYNDLPVYVVDSVFGGAEGLGNVGSNGGGLSSIGVSYTVINCLFSYNRAIGVGANPARPGRPGGGSGGAIYNDGNTFTLSLCGTTVYDNTANEGGGAVFFVSNNRTGTLHIENSSLYNNLSGNFETQGYPGIFYLGLGDPQVVNSSIGQPLAPHHVAIDVNGDAEIGFQEILYVLQVIGGFKSEEMSEYAKKRGDIVFDHEINLQDAIVGLKMMVNEP